MAPRFGELLPSIVTPPPGPRSLALGARLARVESRNITASEAGATIFWTRARGANVRDADGNIYIDLTAGFSVAAAGHANPRVARAAARQLRRLPHALGDVYPSRIKVQLLEQLARVAPAPLEVTILASAGAEAVEAALKTAVMHTGRSGIIAFEGGYHGLTYGALATTSRSDFRAPFLEQLFRGVEFLPYPRAAESSAGVLALLEELLRDRGRANPIGAIIVEPIQGRGGIVVPHESFLPALRAAATQHGVVLIFDEIYTGFGRTGRWFAGEHTGVVPDILTVGKSLSGALPFSAAIGRREIMNAWPPSSGEAIHTSTFLGNPVACAAALAHLREIEEHRLVERSEAVGSRLRARIEQWRSIGAVRDVRGAGLMQGVELRGSMHARAVTHNALLKGVLLLSEGPDGDVLAFTPPLVITEEQLDYALDVIEAELRRL